MGEKLNSDVIREVRNSKNRLYIAEQGQQHLIVRHGLRKGLGLDAQLAVHYYTTAVVAKRLGNAAVEPVGRSLAGQGVYLSKETKVACAVKSRTPFDVGCHFCIGKVTAETSG